MNLSHFLRGVIRNELGEYEREVIKEIVKARADGREYLTFNVVNVQMDFDAGVATIEDELDATRSESLPLPEFLSAISDCPSAHD